MVPPGSVNFSFFILIKLFICLYHTIFMVARGKGAFLMTEGHGGCFQFIALCIFYEKKGVRNIPGPFNDIKK